MPQLSFCIPTYNRSASCLRLVKEILSCSNPNIEVIVSDNYSSDDTLLKLREIGDERLFVYQNKENVGSLLNFFNALKKANGEYIYITTDKDFINASNIDRFITFLMSNQNIACGYCQYQPKPEAKNKIISRGQVAVTRFGYMGRHPSGYFANKMALESTDYLTRFSNKNFVGEFALDFIFAELAVKGEGAIFNTELTIPQSNIEASVDKSLSIISVHTNAYYTPKSRLEIAVNQTIHVNQLELLRDEKTGLIIDRFIRGLISATLEYSSILKNEKICEHYHLEPRNVSVFENIINAFKFFRQYLLMTKLVRKNNNLNAITFSFYATKSLLNKATKRITNNAK